MKNLSNHFLKILRLGSRKYGSFIVGAIAFSLSMLRAVPATQAQSISPAPPNPLQQRIEQLQQRLNDWPQLGFYRAANQKLPPPGDRENRVIFFGDSIIQAWNLSKAFLQQPYINRGIGGQTTPQMLLRFRADVIALQPKVVLILAGTNDIAGNTGPMTLEMIEDNYAAIAELAHAHQIQVIFASVLPIHDYGSVKQSPGRPPAKIQALNEWLKRYCAGHGHLYLDYYSLMSDRTGMLKAELSGDGLHPNAAGYKVMTPLTEAALQQALQQHDRQRVGGTEN